MKKLLLLFSIIAFFGNLTFAQKDDEGPFKIEKSKIISSLDKLALAQITVHYRLTTTAKAIGQEKSSGTVAGAKVSAYLETTDGELTDKDFQEVTDYFYSYFQKKLKEGGIDTVGWSTIVATDFYKNAGDEKSDEGKEEKAENVWVTSNAHAGNVLHSGQMAFAFGKIKKAAAFAEDIGATAGYFDITLDFADVIVNVDIKTKTEGVYYPTVTQKTKYTWGVNPDMQIIPSENASTLFWNRKSQGEILPLKKRGIPGGVRYHDNMSEDVSKARSGLAKQFAFRKEFTPILVETTKEKYKAAAKKTLEKYADAFVAKTKMLRKD